MLDKICAEQSSHCSDHVSYGVILSRNPEKCDKIRSGRSIERNEKRIPSEFLGTGCFSNNTSHCASAQSEKLPESTSQSTLQATKNVEMTSHLASSSRKTHPVYHQHKIAIATPPNKRK